MALLLEGRVADGEDLVDQEDVGVGLHHHGEGQPDVHAGRVVLELQVHELLQLGELDDRVVALARPRRREAEHHPVDRDVVARREIGVEAHPQLDERRDPPPQQDLARVRPIDPGEALEQRALAARVAADDPVELARLDLERHLAQSLEVVERPALERMQRALLQRMDVLVRQPEGLRDLVDGHGRAVCRGIRHGRNGSAA